MHCIQLDGKDYKHINFNIDSRSELSAIYARIQEISIPGLKLDKEAFFHSVTELINNSICAHRDREIDAPVHVRFSIEDDMLLITIKDRGKGFDPAELPYNLDDPVSAIDINGRNFQIYREKYNYKRFGTGLFNAKKTFESFHLSFFNKEGKTVPYDSGNKEGTVISLKTKLS